MRYQAMFHPDFSNSLCEWFPCSCFKQVAPGVASDGGFAYATHPRGINHATGGNRSLWRDSKRRRPCDSLAEHVAYPMGVRGVCRR